MKLNMIIGAATKRAGINKFVYDNNFARNALAFSINNKLPTLEEARNYLSNISFKPIGTSIANNTVTKMKYDLKIIVPAYNVEQYIDECLSSILSQETEYSFFVEVINDGSTDCTRELLKKYEDNPHVNILDQSNKGLSGARNTGLLGINSKYIMFVDSDDKLHPNAVQTLLKKAFNNNSDIVEGGFYIFKKDKVLSKRIHKNNEDVKALGNLFGYAWGKVIRSSFFENVKYPEGYWYEDTIISYLVYSQCKKASMVSDIVYWYRRNPNGINQTSVKFKKSVDTYWIMEQMLNDMKQINISFTQDIYEATLRQIHLNFKRTKRMDEMTQKGIFTLSADIIQKLFSSFKTSSNTYKELESALKTNNYKQYYQFCILL